MNGIKYVFDTNALISFLQGNSNLSLFTSEKSIAVSIISILEFLSFRGIDDDHKVLFMDFINEVNVIELNLNNSEFIDIIVHVRKSFKLKLPDAIVAATAMHINAVLVTNDKDFSNIPTLLTISF